MTRRESERNQETCWHALTVVRLSFFTCCCFLSNSHKSFNKCVESHSHFRCCWQVYDWGLNAHAAGRLAIATSATIGPARTELSRQCIQSHDIQLERIIDRRAPLASLDDLYASSPLSIMSCLPHLLTFSSWRQSVFVHGVLICCSPLFPTIWYDNNKHQHQLSTPPSRSPLSLAIVYDDAS